MRALNQKAVRDVWHMRGQVLAIALVIASGIAVLVMSLSTLAALENTTDAYYERYRFADVFSNVTRAPNRLTQRIAKIPGVQTVLPRIRHFATLDIEGFAEPAMGQLVSIPEDHQPQLNQLVLRSGRWVRFDRPDEVILNEPFAEAHNLQPGDKLVGILNGNRRELEVVGIALSPEFIYSLGPGFIMPDDKRFGVLWMGHDALAAAYDLKGAFNDVSIALIHGATAEPVIAQLDLLLERYGSVGALARKDQLSNWFVRNEMNQLATMSRVLPTVFLAIAAFLTNTLLGRLLATERSQIGLLKAFGYNHWEVGLHYAKIVICIACIGAVVGYLFGAWFGRINTEIYANLFRFPLLLYRPSSEAFVLATGASIVAALLGAAGAVNRAIKLPPAEAMQPPAPPTFRRSRLAASAVGRWLDQPTRIIARNIVRWPGRSLLTGIGIAASVGLMVLSLQWSDALNYLAQSYFFDTQRQHVTLGMLEPQSTRMLANINHLPGVLRSEPVRTVGANLSVGSVTDRGAIIGVHPNAMLQPIYDEQRQTTVPVPAQGLVLGSYLARKLGVAVGDPVWVEILEDRRPELQLPVAEIIDTYIDTPAYMHIDALHRLLKERPKLDYANLLVDSQHSAELYRELKELPVVGAVMLRQAAVDSFYDTVVHNLMVFISIFSSLAAVMAFGVAYNSTRITLSERGRELATLRVLGFSRGEISYILLGEVGLIICAALPFGCAMGYWLARLIADAFSTDLFRVPLLIQPDTYAYAVLIALVSMALSALIVRAKVDRLDLIEVLKSRE